MTQAGPQGPWFPKAKIILPLFFNFWPMVRENSAMTSYHPDDNLFNFHLLCEPIELEYVTIRKTKKKAANFQTNWKHEKKSSRYLRQLMKEKKKIENTTKDQPDLPTTTC